MSEKDKLNLSPLRSCSFNWSSQTKTSSRHKSLCACCLSSWFRHWDLFFYFNSSTYESYHGNKNKVCHCGWQTPMPTSTAYFFSPQGEQCENSSVLYAQNLQGVGMVRTTGSVLKSEKFATSGPLCVFVLCLQMKSHRDAWILVLQSGLWLLGQLKGELTN